MVADFIYQKTLNPGWEGLGRAEKGENDTKNFESEAGIGKARAKLFLTFGIERVIVPEQEIKEFLAYSFADQAMRQLMFNNFRQGDGFADEPVQKDWRSEVRKPDVAQALLLTDPHLTLEHGILEDDQKNTQWKPIRDYWQNFVAQFARTIPTDRNIAETAWVSSLQAGLAKVYDETYRMLGGVTKFYETKSKSLLETARHIALHVEKHLFMRWRSGEASLLQQRQFLAALLEWLVERQASFNDGIVAAGTEMKRLHTRSQELEYQLQRCGHARAAAHGQAQIPVLADRGAAAGADGGAHRARRPQVRGRPHPFHPRRTDGAAREVEEIHQKIAAATAAARDRASQLKEADHVYEKRYFDRAAIDKVVRSMNADEPSQLARTQQVRRAIVDLAGTDVESYSRLAGSLGTSNLRSTLASESARIVEQAHNDLPKTMQPVLHVNIVDRLCRQFDANPEALKEFVAGLYQDAGCMLRLDPGEVNRNVHGNVGGTVGPTQTIGVFVPECDAQKAFRDVLADQFAKQQPPTGETQLKTGRFSNQIAVIKVSSLMPVRFMDSLKDLKTHYDGLRRDRMEAHLLHGEGEGKELPPLFPHGRRSAPGGDCSQRPKSGGGTPAGSREAADEQDHRDAGVGARRDGR